MKILLIGRAEIPHLGGSFYRALKSLGHDVRLVDESLAFGWLDHPPVSSVLLRLRKRLPTRTGAFNEAVLSAAREMRPDMILSLQGSFLTRDTLESLKQSRALLVNYSTDHPFNPAACTPLVPAALPLWDVFATPRAHTIPRLEQHCKGVVVYLPFGYDPEIHFPDPDAAGTLDNDLVFIGVCDRDRVETLRFLSRRKEIAVRFYGGGRRYRLIGDLRRRHGGMVNGKDYRRALSQSKIALSLNRRANEDTHVMRTFEVPACGAFLLAERTSEQLAMFAENREAAFFSGLDELWDKVMYYLSHEEERRSIALAGYRRVTSAKNTYRDRVATLLDRIDDVRS
jgi:spore maturation protein CgeB